MESVVTTSREIRLSERILETARGLLFRYGYKTLTMDLLARELGVSKKTLYQHSAGKDALVGAVLDDFALELGQMAEALFGADELSFTVKLARFTAELSTRFQRLPPNFFRDLERFAPAIFHQLEELRSRNIPVIFGRLIAEGQKAGMVRDSVDPEFATAFWQVAMQGMMHPDTADRLGLRPDQVFTQALSLFCGGLLTSKGMQDYEDQVAN